MSLPSAWRHRGFQPRSTDRATRVGNKGRLICHATETSLSVLALAIAVIEPCFPALLIPPISLAQLLPPAFLPTFRTAVGLSPIAGKADEKHLPAAHGAAKQLSQYQSWSHRLQGRSGQWLSRRATLELVVLVLSTGSHQKRKPRSLLRSGFLLSRLVDSTLPQSLRCAPAMMMMAHSVPACDQKTALLDARRHCFDGHHSNPHGSTLIPPATDDCCNQIALIEGL